MFQVSGQDVGGDRAWVISELGSNHGGDIETARELIKQSALAGADAVKLQIRTNRELYTKAFFEAPYNSENAYGPTYGSHREFLELSPDAHRELKEFAESLGLAYFATAFDFAAVDLCFELDFPAIKIASGSVTNIPLLLHAARTRLPIFLSTGACHLEDVDRAVNAIRAFNTDLCVMQATANYPCEAEDLDLGVLHTYRIRYGHSVIGLSSHFAGIADGPAAYVLGARVFEKHATLNRSAKGTDNAFSLEPNGLRRYIRDLRRVEQMVGDGRKKFRLSEADARTKMGASVYFSKPLRAGHTIEPADICIKSPAAYVAPYELNDYIGKRLVVDVTEEQAVEPSHIEAKARAV